MQDYRAYRSPIAIPPRHLLLTGCPRYRHERPDARKQATGLMPDGLFYIAGRVDRI